MSKTHSIDEIKNRWDEIKDKGIHFAHQVKEKGEDVADSLDKNPKTRDFWRYAKKHKRESIFGVVILLSLVFSFYWLGSAIVGLAVGLYSTVGIKVVWGKIASYAKEQGPFTSFVLAVALVFMLFHVLFFAVGLAVGLLIQSIMLDEFSSIPEQKERSRKTK
jgi:hypothetical protein